MEIKDEDLEVLLKYVDLAFPYKKRLMKIAKKYRALLKHCHFENENNNLACTTLMCSTYAWPYARRMTVEMSLVERAQRYYDQLPPYAKERKGGFYIQELLKEIEDLKNDNARMMKDLANYVNEENKE